MGEINTSATIYSNDRKIYAGMTRDEVYKDTEALKLFTLADKNNDSVIDSEEINRYNGPIYVENTKNKTGRFIYNPSASLINIKSDEVDYYPGLKLEKLNDKHSVETFRAIDTDCDKELTQDELKAYHKQAARDELKNSLEYKNRNIKDFAQFGSIAGSIVSAGLMGWAEVSALPIAAVLAFGTLISFGAKKLAEKYCEHKTQKEMEQFDNNFENQTYNTDKKIN